MSAITTAPSGTVMPADDATLLDFRDVAMTFPDGTVAEYSIK